MRATTRRMWISPPMVVLVTSPRIQRMTRTMATVINIKSGERRVGEEGVPGGGGWPRPGWMLMDQRVEFTIPSPARSTSRPTPRRVLQLVAARDHAAAMSRSSLEGEMVMSVGLGGGRPGLVGEGILGLFDGVFDGFAGLAGAALDAADEFVHFAVCVLEVVVGEVGPLLFEFAFDDVPVAFDFEFSHRVEDQSGCEGLPWGETLMGSLA